MDRGAWWAVIHGIPKESDTTEELNNNNTGLIIQKLSTSQFSLGILEVYTPDPNVGEKPERMNVKFTEATMLKNYMFP